MFRSSFSLAILALLSACASSSQLKMDRAEVIELRKEVKELKESLEASRRELALVKASLETMKEPHRPAAAPAARPRVLAVPPPHPSTGIVTEESRKASQQHYLSGVIYFQKGDYQKAREEWKFAGELDPANDDSKAGLRRIEQIFGGH